MAISHCHNWDPLDAVQAFSTQAEEVLSTSLLPPRCKLTWGHSLPLTTASVLTSFSLRQLYAPRINLNHRIPPSDARPLRRPPP